MGKRKIVSKNADADADAGRKPALKRKTENAAEKLCMKYVRGYGPVTVFCSKEELDELMRKNEEECQKAHEEQKRRYLEAQISWKESKKNEEVKLRMIGFIFSPSDEVLVNYYLKNRTLGPIFDLCPIDDFDVYANHPRTLTEKFTPNGGVWYFFTKSRPNESVDVGGQWEFGEKNDVFDNGVKVGLRQELEFNGEGDQNGNGKYKIVEYQVDPVTSAPLFLCKLYQTE